MGAYVAWIGPRFSTGAWWLAAYVDGQQVAYGPYPSRDAVRQAMTERP